MNFETTHYGPAFTRGHLQYIYEFYKAKPYRALPHSERDGWHARPEIWQAPTDVSPLRALDRPQTVEQIVARGYLPVPQGELETAMLSDKKHTSWLGLDDAIRQIRWRYRIYERNRYEIELAKCSATNALLSIENTRGCGTLTGREVQECEKSLHNLYGQQWTERVRLWQDVSRLRQTLPEIAQECLSAYRKVSIIGDIGGDLP